VPLFYNLKTQIKMKKFKITSIGPFAITLKAEDGTEVTVGVHKHTLKYLELKAKKVDDVVELLVEQSTTTGRWFCVDSMQREKSLFGAEKIMAERKIMDLTIKHKEALLESAV
jgi:hypothetical protein